MDRAWQLIDRKSVRYRVMVTPELHIQFAIKVGAVSITLTRSSSKRQALLIAGAAHAIATDE